MMSGGEFPELGYQGYLGVSSVPPPPAPPPSAPPPQLSLGGFQGHLAHLEPGPSTEPMPMLEDSLDICDSMYLGMRAGPAHEQAGPASCGPDSRAHSRKRKSSVPADSYLKSPRGSYSHSALESTGSEDYDDDTGDDKSVRTTDENKKQNHSEIEKRRRDKMNTYIQELSGMVPLCAAMARKLDKLTVLRLAVQHLKTVRGAARTLAEGALRSPFLSDADVKALVLRAADGFLFVVGCDRGRILYVSESVSRILNYSPGELLGQNWFDILHPKDVAKVKEQLSSSDLSPRERLIDAKTMLPVKADVPQGASKLCPGARRSFFCRMKCRAPAPGTTPSQGPGPPPPSQHLKEESDSASSASTPQTHRRKKHASSDKRYSVIQCSGYLKSWAGEGGPAAPSALGAGESRGGAEGGEAPDLGGGGSLSCLVAVGRPHPSSSSPPQPPPRPTATQPRCRPLYFISRHAMDGKFLFVDQRSTIVLGFLPQELLGTSMYEYFHPEDIPQLAEAHKLALLSGEKTSTPAYRMKAKEGGCVLLRSEWRAFRNPWTKELEYLIAKNCVISEDHSMPNDATVASSSSGMANTFDFLGQASGREMQKYISSHVESSKIGSQIASQVLEGQTRGDSEGNSPIQEQGFPSPLRLPMEPSSVLTMSPLGHPLGLPPNGALPSFSEVRALSPPAPSQPLLSDSMGLGGSEAEGEGDGSDEAAMAVIMSLLEADAGLGGPVDFSGLPWPLP